MSVSTFHLETGWLLVFFAAYVGPTSFGRFSGLHFSSPQRTSRMTDTQAMCPYSPRVLGILSQVLTLVRGAFTY